MLRNFQNFTFKTFVLIVKLIVSYVELTIFLLLLASGLNTIVHNKVVPKTVVKKFSFSELKIKKVKFFTQHPTKIFALAFLKLAVA